MVSLKLIRLLSRCVLIACAAMLLSQAASAAPSSSLVVEVESGRILNAESPRELRHPASLTKMMTLFMVFESLSRHQLSLSDRVRFSFYAASKPPSKLGLDAGDSITVEEAILALVTQSANDAATALAETMGGTESAFAYRMTQRAHRLGMSDTVFRNASGLPDSSQVTTAWDMYILGKALMKQFPQYYRYFSVDNFNFRGRSFRNHNHLLFNYAGTDGIKTGYVSASGYNLVTSARRNGVRLIGVVFGGSSASMRDALMRDILDESFAQLDGLTPSSRYAGFRSPPAPQLLHRPQEMERVLTRSGDRMVVQSRPVGDKSRTDNSVDDEEDDDDADGDLPVARLDDSPVYENSDVVSQPLPKQARAVKQPLTASSRAATLRPAEVEPERRSLAVRAALNKLGVRTEQQARVAGGKSAALAKEPAQSNNKNQTKVGAGWHVRVGAFSQANTAENQLKQAIKITPYSFRHASPGVSALSVRGKRVYLAFFKGMNKDDAAQACKELTRRKFECLAGQEAS